MAEQRSGGDRAGDVKSLKPRPKKNNGNSISAHHPWSFLHAAAKIVRLPLLPAVIDQGITMSLCSVDTHFHPQASRVACLLQSDHQPEVGFVKIVKQLLEIILLSASKSYISRFRASATCNCLGGYQFSPRSQHPIHPNQHSQYRHRFRSILQDLNIAPWSEVVVGHATSIVELMASDAAFLSAIRNAPELASFPSSGASRFCSCVVSPS